MNEIVSSHGDVKLDSAPISRTGAVICKPPDQIETLKRGLDCIMGT